MNKALRLLRFSCFVLLLLLGGVRPAAAAVTCAAYSGPDANFGDITLYDGGVVDAISNVAVGCNNGDTPVPVLLCLSLGTMPPSPEYNPRYMPLLDGSQVSRLAFNIYQDSAKTKILGSIDAGAGAEPLALRTTIPPYYGEVNIPVYLDIKTSAQTSIPVGRYGGNLPAKLTYIVNPGLTANCTAGQTFGSTWASNIYAEVLSQCYINSASDMSFGSVYGLLDHTVESSSSISVTCSPGQNYQISLDNGLHASGVTRRMKEGADGYISYELYRNSQRTLRWGQTIDTDTVAGSGTGLPQVLPVYGRVLPQTLSGSGVFSDTIVVTVTY